MLSNQTLREIAEGTGNQYNYDFSMISGDLYESLFRSLQKFSINHIESIGFSCSFLTHYSPQRSPKQISPKVKKSIANTKIHYIKNMVELLYFVMPRSKVLHEITLTNLPMKYAHIERFASSFAKPNFIDTLNFNTIKLFDEGAAIILSYLTESHVVNISFQNCYITDSILNIIISLIQSKKKTDYPIQNFDAPELSSFSQQQIRNAIKDYQVQNDLSNFSSGSDFQEIQEEISPIYQDPSSSKQDSIYQQIEELKKENNELREQIQLFKDLTKQVQITDNIYAIGEKASDFADHLKDLTKRLSTIDNNMHFV